MISYRVTYQIRRKASLSVPQGDWQDKESVVVAGEDAMEAICKTVEDNSGYDFRLKEIKVNGRVDMIAKSLR